MSFPRYGEYKDSGVEWLGEIPVHWDIVPLRRAIASIDSGTSVNSIDSPASDDELGVLKTSCVYRGAFDPQENKAVLPEEYPRVSCPVAAGSLIVSRMNTPDLVGAAGLVEHPADRLYLPDRLWQVRFRDADASFVHRWTQSLFYRSQVQIVCAGASSSMQNLSQEDFRAFLLPSPPPPEQTAIAAFLDRETAKIDDLVAEQQNLIALLKEKRQALISHAVTKGLDPNVPMKKSGVEWLGEVPSHWEIKAIKWLSPVQRGASPRPIDDPKYFDETGEYAWVRIADVSASSGFLTETTQQMSALGSRLSVMLEPGSLFVSIAGTVGKPCVTAIKACIHDGFVYFPRLTIDQRLLYRIFESGGCYGGLGKMGTQLNLNTDTIGSIRVALPPPLELSAVLDFIDRETAKIDNLVAEAESTITLLQERRTALISAAVTGKIDVRNVISAQEKATA